MTGDELWAWWFAKTNATPRSIGVYERAQASRVVREAQLENLGDADAYYDWLSSWFSGVDMNTLLRYADRWLAFKAGESAPMLFIRKHGGRW